jgi:prepilin-type processing-associated H-X9-DG protein
MSTSKGTYPYGYFDGAQNNNTDYATTTPTNPNVSDWMTLTLQSMGKGGGTYGTLPPPSDRSIFVCPTASPEKAGFVGSTLPVLHYACHPRLMPNLDQKEPDPDLPGYNKYMTPYKAAHLKRTSEIILIFDGAQFFKDRNGSTLPWAANIDSDGLYVGFTQQGRQWNYLIAKDGMDLSVAVYTPNQDYTTLGSKRADIRWRHGRNDAANFLFADCHAEGRRLKFGVNAELKLNNLYVNP